MSFHRETQPRVTDNDRGEITVTFDGRELRGWSYKIENEDERRVKMGFAREYVEGWCDGGKAALSSVSYLRTK